MNSNKLKLIAIITMLIDHTGYALFPDLIILRIIGRLSFPIFMFLIAEGYIYTRSVNQYMIRLGVFALLSEIPFDLAFHGEILEFQNQNIFFTLLLGLVAIKLYHQFKERSILLASLFVALTCVVSFVLKTDYYVFGVLIIFSFHQLRAKPIARMALSSILLIFLTLVIAMSKGSFGLDGTYQIFSLASLGLIYFYNGQPGIKLGKLKYVLYAFYPVHLISIYLIRIVVG